MMTRRAFLGTASTLALAGCTIPARPPDGSQAFGTTRPNAMPAFYGPVPDEQFPLPAVPAGVVASKYWRQQVANPFPQYAPGTVIVDPQNFYLHLVEEDGRAMRYGIGVGRQGFAWSGDAVIQYKRKWPRWKAPDDMVRRQPELEPYSVANGGMDPGLMNPLGARALYLFQNGRDTLYRIHGNPEANSIGRSVSSGCIRLLNHDIIHLHDRVPNQSRVIVLQANRPAVLS
ncbi:MAG: L,D-transpeptidase [Pseudomonadota bacterium]